MAFNSTSTPESLLPRADSKNPATTCKGITSSGRPCRRSLAASATASLAASARGRRGVLAVVPAPNGGKQSAAAFYCWQHQDQAGALIGAAGGETELVSLQARTSTDSLAAQLGVLDIDDAPSSRTAAGRTHGPARPIRRDTLPSTWQGVASPLMSVPEDQIPMKSKTASRTHRRGDLHVTFLCCARSSDADGQPNPAPKPAAPDQPSTKRPTRAVPSRIQVPARARTSGDGGGGGGGGAQPVSTANPHASPPASYSQANRNAGATQPPSAYTQALLSFIPADVHAAARDQLLAELSKPLTEADREPGYIYIFWLTPRTAPQPGASDASTLLAPPPPPPPSSRPSAHERRRSSDIMRTYSVRAPAPGAPQRRTLMLKIGRANNVHRRMVEWSRQCGHHITLLRYYPVASQRRGGGGASPTPSPAASPARRPAPSPRDARAGADADADANADANADADASAALPTMVPLVPRVERLIHAELAAQRVVRACDGCGRQHREWFAIDASRDGVRSVDQTVRRWVEWGIEEGKGL